MTIQVKQKPSDILKAKGWVQGHYQNGITGACCAVGAMKIACGGENACQSVYVVTGDTGYEFQKLYAFAEKKFSPEEDKCPAVVRWNDNPNRTKEEVIAFFEALEAELGDNLIIVP